MAINRPIKALFYAPPGTGKSVFASQSPQPFFICPDGNYEWLLDFGAKPDAHKDISSYAEFERLALTSDFDGYDTIVVDLLEDIYKWNESEFCKKQGVDHLSDAGAFGKGWDITRTRLFVACCKLLSLPKNIIFLSHESSYTVKDRRGNETTRYTASNLMGEKFIVMLEGRLRYFLRCMFKDEILPDGKVITHRMLSLVPKSNEYGIIRGVDVNIMPQDIELDAKTFLQTVGYDFKSHADGIDVLDKAVNQSSVKPAKKAETVHEEKVEAKHVEEMQAIEAKPAEIQAEKQEEQHAMPISDAETTIVPAKEDVKVEVVKEQPEIAKEAPSMKAESTSDKLAAIKAKLAAIKAQKGGN